MPMAMDAPPPARAARPPPRRVSNKCCPRFHDHDLALTPQCEHFTEVCQSDVFNDIMAELNWKFGPIWEASASVSSLLFTLVGIVITLPAILFYTIYVYRVFRGKATELSYD